MARRHKPDAIIGINDDQLADAAAAMGSLQIDEEELEAAFEFFDVEKTGKLTAAGLKQRLGTFYRSLPQKEIKLLLGDGAFTKETLRGLLQNNDLGAYDPTAEAFKAYDPNGTGFVDEATLRSIFESLGYGEITEEDLQVLIETADGDRDGRISLEDFRSMLSFSKGSDASAPAPAAEAPSASTAQPDEQA
jgi:calmodulin